MRHKILIFAFVGVLVTSMFAGCAAIGDAEANDETLQFTGSSVELTLEPTGLHMLVQGDIEGFGARKFIVDTGSGVNVIDEAIAKQMGLEVIGEKEVMSGGSVPVTADIVIVPQIKLGDLIVQNAEFLSLELDTMSGGLLQGILGMELFKDVLLTIDAPNERVLLSRSNLSKEDPNTIPFNAANSHIHITADVAGHDVKMTLDVGAPGGFTLPANIIDTVPIQGVWDNGGSAQLVGGERSMSTAVLDGDIVLAGMTYANPQLSVLRPSPPNGNIGNAVLGELVLKIDQKNGLLELDKAVTNQAEASQTASTPRRLGVEFRGVPGQRLSAGRVLAGSVGESVGFKSGDVFISLNERPIEEYDMGSLGKLIKGTTPLIFEIDRDGTQQFINVD